MRVKKIINTFPLTIVLILVIVGIVGHNCTLSEANLIPIWPLTGVAAGLFIGTGEKHKWMILFGLFLGHFLGRMIFDDFNFLTSFLVSALTAVEGFFFILGFCFLKRKFLPNLDLTPRNIIIYLGVVLLPSIILIAIETLIVSIIVEEIHFIDAYLRWLVGEYMGFIIFGSISIVAIAFDEPISFNKTHILGTSLILLAFGVISYFAFSDKYPMFTYESYSFLFIVLFVITGFAFNYRLILFLALLFISMAEHIYFSTLSIDSLPNATLRLLVFLLVATMTSSVIRRIVISLKEYNWNLKSAAEDYTEIVNATMNLLSLGTSQSTVGKRSDDEYFKELFSIASKVFDNFDAASCYVKTKHHVRFIDAIGYDIDKLNDYNIESESFNWTDDLPQHFITAKSQTSEPDNENYKKFLSEIISLKEAIRIIIKMEGNLFGGMSFDINSNSDKSFNDVDYQNYLNFQNLINSFFDISQLQHEKSILHDDLILSLVRTLELYDHYTRGHSEDVASLASMIGKQLRLSLEAIDQLYWAGIVHDIGKIGVNQSIINKPGKLTPDEYEQIKEHAKYGYNILRKSEPLKDIARIVKHHHEKWDGTGYPDRLSKDDIPLASQILSIADAISTMATKRPYNVVKTPEEIQKELLSCSGTQFSPFVVDKIIPLFENGSIKRHYRHFKKI